MEFFYRDVTVSNQVPPIPLIYPYKKGVEKSRNREK